MSPTVGEVSKVVEHRRSWPPRTTIVVLVVVISVVAAAATILFLRRDDHTNQVEEPSVQSVPASAVNCAPAPSACGYPDSSNTGVQPSLTLSRVPEDIAEGDGWHYDERGWISVDEDGADIDGIAASVPIEVQANNVTVRNSRISVSGESWGIALRHTAGTTVDSVTIAPPPGAGRLLVGIKDIYGDSSGTRILRSDISGTSTGIQIYEGLIERNYLHDFGMQEGDHINGTTSNGSVLQLDIRNNTIFNQFGQTDAVSFFQDFGLEANRTVSGNLLAGGGYTIYGGQNEGAPQAYNIKITNNRISRIYFPAGGFYGPVTAFDPDAPGNEWSGNRWDDTGDSVPPT